MNLRTVLLTSGLALAGTAVHAEELQFTIRGNAECIFGASCPSEAVLGPGTITFDLNTQAATLVPTFGANPLGGARILTNLVVSFPVTNYSAVVNGQTIGFAAHGTGGFGCGPPVLGSPAPTYDCAGEFGLFNFDDDEIWIHALTESQYKALRDPLAAILLAANQGVTCGNGGLTCYMDQSAGRVQFASTFTVTPVPTPIPLSLFLLGLGSLAFSRNLKRLVS